MDESSLTVESSDQPTGTPCQETPEYNARVVIAVNRTGRKKDKCYKEYSKLPDSTVTVAKNLEEFFDSLNMKVDLRENVDKTAINEMVSKVIEESPSYGDHEMILFYYIGHGERGELLPHCTCETCDPSGEHVRKSDGQPQQIVDLVQKFHNSGTKHLRRLPVLFFFDCCQGSDHNDGIAIYAMGTIDPGMQMKVTTKYVGQIPDCGNILIAHSTLPLLKAYCDPVHGPIWSYTFLKNLKVNQSISDALHATQREVSAKAYGVHQDAMVIQPSMFYSTLYCQPINFYAMKDSFHRAVPETGVSSMGDCDSAFVDDFHSKAIEGDDTHSGSELPQGPISADSQHESSSSSAFSKQLKKLQKDIEEKNEKVLQLEGEIKLLKKKAKDEEQEYKIKLADKEREMNTMKEDHEQTLKEKEKELMKTRDEARASELKNRKEMDKLTEDLDKLKIKYDKEKHEIELLRLNYAHLQETKKLALKISEQETELERKLREVAEQKTHIEQLVAKEKVNSALKERDAALKERNAALKERDAARMELKRQAGKVDEAAEVQKLMTSNTSTSTSSSSTCSRTVPSSDTPANGPN